MIQNKKDLKYYIKEDIKPFSFGKKHLLYFYAWLTKDFNFYRLKFSVHLRKLEYYINVHPKMWVHRIYHKYKKNKIGRMFGWEIPSNVCGPGLHLWHPNVVINDDAKIGSNALFHGNNCIGRKKNGYPKIGDNFDMGYGSVAVGNIILGDNVIVGSNSFVNKNFESNCVIGGVPSKILKKYE